MFADARAELQLRQAQKANVEALLGEINAKIEAMTKTYNAIAPLVDEQPISSVADAVLFPDIEALKAAGISVAAKFILDSAATENFTPAEVRDRLAKQGWDWGKYTNPLATVHTVLVRLAESKAVKEDRTPEGRKCFYSANRISRLAVPVLTGGFTVPGSEVVSKLDTPIGRLPQGMSKSIPPFEGAGKKKGFAAP